jgi:hypothetical protein
MACCGALCIFEREAVSMTREETQRQPNKHTTHVITEGSRKEIELARADKLHVRNLREGKVLESCRLVVLNSGAFMF